MLGTEPAEDEEKKDKFLSIGETGLGKVVIIEMNGEILEAKRLMKVGGSFAFVIPKVWLELFCKEQDGSYLLAYKLGDSIIELIGTQDPYRRQEK